MLIEFVSANPTGPLTAAGGRHAAYGDALARLLELAGHEVEREYYVNDHGSQVRKLGESIRARARGEPVPEGGYEGDYVGELAAELGPTPHRPTPTSWRSGEWRRWCARFGPHWSASGCSFDTFFSERSLHEADPSPVERHYAELERRGHIFRSEGAVWLRTSEFGDDKDRVCAAPTATTPTSPPTSPTTRTSASGASTA